MQITPLKESYIQEIILLSNNAFGQGFLSESYIKQYIDSSKNTSLALVDDKKLVGYILVDNLPYNDFITVVLEKKDWFKEYFNTYKRISLIKQVVVAEQYQNRGNANQLIKQALNETNILTDITCCLAWKKENHVSLKSTLLKNSFTYKLTIENYWEKDSNDKNYMCAFCGTPPCNCSTEVYILLK